MTINPGADYPWDPAVQAEMAERGEAVPEPPKPPAIPAPGPGGGMPAARLGDLTVHFGVIGPAVTGMTVLIGFQPAATMGDPHICPMFDGPKPHVGGTILKGSATVLICNKPAARVGDTTECKGPPGAIAPPGCPTVLIGDSSASGGGGGSGGEAGASLAGASAANSTGSPSATSSQAIAPSTAVAGPDDAGSGPVDAGVEPSAGVSEPEGPLTESVLEKVGKCQDMKDDLENLQRDGWRFVSGAEGAGTYADRSTKTITLDPAMSEDQVVAALAHEMGHAQYEPPTVSPNGLTREEYVQRAVQASLEDEGEATLKTIEYKKCLHDGGGPDISVPGAMNADYERIAAEHPNAEDRATARTEVANIFGDNEHPSNAPTQTYRQYYGTPQRDWAAALTDDQWTGMGGEL